MKPALVRASPRRKNTDAAPVAFRAILALPIEPTIVGEAKGAQEPAGWGLISSGERKNFGGSPLSIVDTSALPHRAPGPSASSP